MVTFSKNYFIITVLLFLAEVLIALFVRDEFIRPYVGDFLVVILVYSFLKSFLDFSTENLAVSALVFAYLVELLQFLDLLKILGLSNSEIFRIILGSQFEWMDMLVYTLSFIVILLTERFRRS